MLDAATRLFADRGWAATTLARVAAEAGTVVETVYSGFGSKASLLCQAIDVALVGDDEPVPFAERKGFRDLGAGKVPTRIKDAAQLIAQTHARSVRLLRALQEAAASDPVAAERWARYEQDRREVIEVGLALITGRQLTDRTVDEIWALASPEVIAKLVLDRGWTIDEYEHWLAERATPLVSARRVPRR